MIIALSSTSENITHTRSLSSSGGKQNTALEKSSIKSPDGKKVSNFAILLVFPTTCHANAVQELHKKLEGTQHGINMDENGSLKLCCTKVIDFIAQKLPIKLLLSQRPSRQKCASPPKPI